MATEKQEFLTDEQVDIEIQRLLNSDAVKLARKEQQIKNRKRQHLYTLRYFEKRGNQLIKEGFTLDNIQKILCADEEEEEES